MKSVQPNKSPRERREALLEEKRASCCTVDSIVRNANHVTIGAFTIYQPHNGHVKIDNANGEGGNFEVGLVEHTIRHAFQLYF